jgi:hypothetical protein
MRCKTQEEILVETESGHIIKVKIEPEVLVDIENDENGLPFFSVAIGHQYVGVEKTENCMSLDIVKQEYANANIINTDYDHIQIGFVYSPEDPNNHRWMLNLMDVNNEYVGGFVGDKITVNCPFTTTSWEDGIWHGRFVVYKKDVKELIEPKAGVFVLNGEGDIGDHKLTELDPDIEKISLSYSIKQNTWYCSYLKDNEVIGSTPCKDIICDVPIIGKIDRNYDKPKVTADIDSKDVKGISVALNALIIKGNAPHLET